MVMLHDCHINVWNCDCTHPELVQCTKKQKWRLKIGCPKQSFVSRIWNAWNRKKKSYTCLRLSYQACSTFQILWVMMEYYWGCKDGKIMKRSQAWACHGYRCVLLYLSFLSLQVENDSSISSAGGSVCVSRLYKYPAHAKSDAEGALQSTRATNVCACGFFTFPRQALNHQSPGSFIQSFYITTHRGAFSRRAELRLFTRLVGCAEADVSHCFTFRNDLPY